MKREKFTINISEAQLDDLRSRLSNTRWPQEISGSAWDYGTDLSYMKQLVRYWIHDFDWRRQEQLLNEFAHYTSEIDGLLIHFIHERGKGQNRIPLIITHGWPGTFAEMVKIIPLLTEHSFDVIVPSLPGYGFSQAPAQRGFHTFRIAEMWHKLMIGLGYERFGAQGGDWGANVTTLLALLYPQNLLGIHLNYIPGSYMPYTGAGERALSAEELKFLKDVEEWRDQEGAYGHIQRTQPQTLAYAMNDSPAGLAAWIVEKFRSWADCDGDLAKRFTADELLTNVCIYWFTQTFPSSVRLYYEGNRRPLRFEKGQRITPPAGIACFAKEAPFPPREWIERCYNIRSWSDFPQGGHFAAMEEPELLANDIRTFFKSLSSR